MVRERCGGRRGGFTLVELLVVVSIIGVLVGLLLPAVGGAREAARRSGCQNNMRAVGTGLIQFLDLRGHLPNAGTWGEDPNAMRTRNADDSAIRSIFDGRYGQFVAADPGAGRRRDVGPLHSWVVDVLPTLDLQEVSNDWDRDRVYFDAGGRTTGAGGADSASRPSNAALADRTLPILLCPSDDRASDRSGSLSFVVSGGFSRWSPGRPDLGWVGTDGLASQPTTGPGPDWSTEVARLTAVFALGTAQGDAPWDGKTRQNSFHDGLGNTLLLSENLLAGASEGNPFNDGTPTSWASPHPNFVMFVGSDDICEGGCFSGSLRPLSAGSADGPGWGLANRAGGPESINGGHRALRAKGAAPYPSSNHPGGVNATMGDGSVRFVRDGIDGSVWSKLLTPAGSRLPAAIRQLPLDHGSIE